MEVGTVYMYCRALQVLKPTEAHLKGNINICPELTAGRAVVVETASRWR